MPPVRPPYQPNCSYNSPAQHGDHVRALYGACPPRAPQPTSYRRPEMPRRRPPLVPASLANPPHRSPPPEVSSSSSPSASSSQHNPAALDCSYSSRQPWGTPKTLEGPPKNPSIASNHVATTSNPRKPVASQKPTGEPAKTVESQRKPPASSVNGRDPSSSVRTGVGPVKNPQASTSNTVILENARKASADQKPAQTAAANPRTNGEPAKNPQIGSNPSATQVTHEVPQTTLPSPKTIGADPKTQPEPVGKPKFTATGERDMVLGRLIVTDVANIHEQPSGTEYVCLVCKKFTAMTYGGIQDHVREHECRYFPFRCWHCAFYFSSRKALRLHSDVVGVAYFKCLSCETFGDEMNQMVAHMRASHDELKEKSETELLNRIAGYEVLLDVEQFGDFVGIIGKPE